MLGMSLRVTDLASRLLDMIELVAKQEEAKPRGVYAKVMNEAPKRFAALPGRTLAIRSAGNGSRPVFIYIPKSFDVKAPATLVTHFAGKLFDYSSANQPAARLKELEDLESSRLANPIYVFPQGLLDNPTDRWMRADEGESLSRMHREVLWSLREALPQLPNIATRVVAAHSGGGSALQNAISAGELEADKLLLLDCFYETRGNNWWQTIASWINDRKSRGTSLRVAGFFATNEAARVRDFKARVSDKLGDSLTIVQSPHSHMALVQHHFSPVP